MFALGSEECRVCTNLRPDQPTKRLLPTPNRLIPRSLRTSWIILGDRTRRGCRQIADFGRGLGGFVLELGFVLLGLAGVLVVC